MHYIFTTIFTKKIPIFSTFLQFLQFLYNFLVLEIYTIYTYMHNPMHTYIYNSTINFLQNFVKM